jgi:transcriptional regulator with XRE-family HTH domain
MMNGRSLVARNVRRVRVKKGISQERLAFDFGVDRSYLGGVERETERQRPPLDLLDRLAGTLEVPLAELFVEAGRDERKPAGLKRGRRRVRPE